MAYKITDVFELLFPDAGAEARRLDAADPNETFRWPESDYTLWFPDPGEPSESTLESVDEARRLLATKIARSAKAWDDNDPWWRRGKSVDDEVFIQRGERTKAVFPDNVNPIRHIPPRLPYDVFLIAAYLIEAAGVYHHIQAEKTTMPGPDGVVDSKAGPRHIAITKADRDQVVKAANAWRTIPPSLFQEGHEVELAKHLVSKPVWSALCPLFQSWLVVFAAYEKADVFIELSARPHEARPAPRWWFHVWRLLAIADEAAAGTGFAINLDELMAAGTDETRKTPWFEMERLYAFTIQTEKRTVINVGLLTDGIGPDDAAREGADLAEFRSLASGRQEVGCVLPKVRTSTVGCTLRSLSHHLALLPGVGVARGKWKPSIFKPSTQPQPMPRGQMNMLLVPLPFSVSGQAFQGSLVQRAETEDATVAYGYFRVHQEWLQGGAGPEGIVSFLDDLVEAARKQADKVNAVVFPELSLDYRTYTAIKNYLMREVPEIELLVAGLSSKPDGRTGNFVAVTAFRELKGEGSDKIASETIREKHHRWKLDAGQLASYGLLGVLSPEVAWWEDIELLSRRVDFTVLREKSVVAALICEDLARVDPCQLLLRSVGPNLVISLLMDASQANGRWPARYATVLAEDPGCAVLTLTSRALMTRQHRLGVYRSTGEDRFVAMWREDGNSTPRSIHCPYDAQGILLTIQEGRAEDISLDGRRDANAMAWRYGGHIPLRSPGARDKYADLLGLDDLACW